jgi:predicted DNA-binding WGR domain protein
MSWTFPPGSRYYECVVPAVNTEKFWCYRLLPELGRVATPQVTVEIHWGRIGTSGQSQSKAFQSATEARDFVNDKTVEKLRKGYLERDRDWVQRMWPQWRPPIAIDALEAPAERRARPPFPGGSRRRTPDELYANIRPRVEAATKVNPGRVAPRAPLPARAGRRVIDFTEE